MRSITIVSLVFALAMSGGMPAVAHDMGGMHASAHKTEADAVGVVEGIDMAKGIVTITHEPIPSLNWPGMTMDFVVKDKTLLKKLATGKKINFSFVEEHGDYLVIKVK